MTLLTIYPTAINLPITAQKPTYQNTNSVPYDTPESRFYLESCPPKRQYPVSPQPDPAGRSKLLIPTTKRRYAMDFGTISSC